MAIAIKGEQCNRQAMSEGSKLGVDGKNCNLSRNMTSPLAITAYAACSIALVSAAPALAQDDAEAAVQATPQTPSTEAASTAEVVAASAQQIEFEAEQLEFDNEADVLTARGNVILRAERASAPK